MPPEAVTVTPADGDMGPQTGRKMLLAVFLSCTPCAIGGVAAVAGGIGVALTWKGVVGFLVAAASLVIGVVWLRRRRRSCPV